MFNSNPTNFGVCLKFNLFFVVVTFYKTLYSELSELFAAFCARFGRRILVNGLPSLGEKKRGGMWEETNVRNNHIVGELCTYTCHIFAPIQLWNRKTTDWLKLWYELVQRTLTQQLCSGPRTITFNILIFKILVNLLCSFYRATHKGWNCKDDRKLLKYDDSKVKLSLLL